MANNRETLIRSAISCVSQYGLEGTRTQQITDRAGLSPAALYKHFESKEELLRTCFETVDQQIAALFTGMWFSEEQVKGDPEGTVFLMWSKYFHWLVIHPEETLFYFAYRTTPAFVEFERSRQAPWFQDFAQIFREFDRQYHLYEYFQHPVLWGHMHTVTQLYAKLVIEGFIPNDDQTIRQIFNIQMAGVCGIMREGGR